MTEIWKDIKYYEGFYQISNLGKVKSLPRQTKNQFGKSERILLPNINTYGYPVVSLSKLNKRITRLVHLLVWDHFGSEKRNGLYLQVDHIDNNKENACISNLQLLNNRENSSKAKLENKKNNLPTGVSFDKRYNKFKAEINVSGKKISLGYYSDPNDARFAYLRKLELINA